MLPGCCPKVRPWALTSHAGKRLRGSVPAACISAARVAKGADTLQTPAFSSTARPLQGVPAPNARIAIEKSKPFYLTTPIFYVNADPHIGHLYTAVLSDILVRWNALRHQGRSPAGPLGPAPKELGPLFCTGTDEHGLKIQRAAADLSVSPRNLCDQVSTRFRDLTQAAGIAASTFIRTTEPRHSEAVQHIWRLLKEKDMIYQGEHQGWYAVSDEAFYPETQVSDFQDPKTGEVYKVCLSHKCLRSIKPNDLPLHSCRPDCHRNGKAGRMVFRDELQVSLVCHGTSTD